MDLERNCMQIIDGVGFVRVVLEGVLLSGSNEL
jgi:hypothetical protein